MEQGNGAKLLNQALNAYKATKPLSIMFANSKIARYTLVYIVILGISIVITFFAKNKFIFMISLVLMLAITYLGVECFIKLLIEEFNLHEYETFIKTYKSEWFGIRFLLFKQKLLDLIGGEIDKEELKATISFLSNYLKKGDPIQLNVRRIVAIVISITTAIYSAFNINFESILSIILKTNKVSDLDKLIFFLLVIFIIAFISYLLTTLVLLKQSLLKTEKEASEELLIFLQILYEEINAGKEQCQNQGSTPTPTSS